jgi:hypothetical protein
VYAENQYLGSRKSKLWTYMIVALGFVIGAVAVNLVIKDPELAQKGIETFFGLPRWAFPIIGVFVGAIIFRLGLNIEADWPEALGAFLVAASVAAAQILFGWNKLAIGGLVLIPYAIPVVIFLVLMMMGTARSK